MRIFKLCVFGLMTAFATIAAALDLPPPIWSTKPDVGAFEKIENQRLDAAQRSIGKIDGEAVEQFLVALRAEEDLGARTYNHYLQAFGEFCKWLVETADTKMIPVRWKRGCSRIRAASLNPSRSGMHTSMRMSATSFLSKHSNASRAELALRRFSPISASTTS